MIGCLRCVLAENNTTKWTYSYDNRGNILSKKEYIVNVDENNESVYTEKANSNYVYDEEWKDKLTSYNGQTISYDESGNPTSYLGHNLTWTMGRQMSSFDNTTYTYNENGIRTSKSVGEDTTEFYLDDTDIIIYQTDGTNDIYFFYDSYIKIVGFKYNGNNYFYIKNTMGDITDIADENGNIVASYTYDPWGRVTSVSGSNLDIANLNPFRYRSYYYDSDIQMYYLQSRYYDPEVGRFINCDDVNYIGLSETNVSYNPFAYCLNNPILNMDEDGYFNLSGINNVLQVLKKVARIFKWINDLLYDSLKFAEDKRSRDDMSVKGGKYQIIISFYKKKVKKTWIKVWRSGVSKTIIDYMSEIALQKFKSDKKREFLLNRECISNEIYMHLHGYMWSIGEAKTCPIKFSAYYSLKGKKSDKDNDKKSILKELQRMPIFMRPICF